LVDRDSLPWLGCDKKVRRLLLFATPRKLGHCAEEASCTLGRGNLCKLLWDLAIDGKLLQLWKMEVAEAIVPTHEFSLVLSSGKWSILILGKWR
jgi:hypothetical protein